MTAKRTTSWVSALATASILFFAASSPALAAAKAAYGSAAYSAFALLSSVEFEVYESDPAREDDGGELYYADTDANWYAVDVVTVRIEDDKAFFAGEIVDASRDSWRGLWVSVAVEDGESEGDLISVKLVGKTQALNSVDEGYTLGTLFNVVEGDISIK